MLIFYNMTEWLLQLAGSVTCIVYILAIFVHIYCIWNFYDFVMLGLSATNTLDDRDLQIYKKCHKATPN